MLNRGFTIVEIMVVISVTGVLVGMVLGPLYDLYQSNVKGIQSVAQATDTKRALRVISDEIEYASAFHQTNTTDPIGANPSGANMTQKWTGTTYSYAGSGVNNRILITSQYATSVTPGNDSATAPTRQLALRADCIQPVENTVIYYVRDNSLYRRVIPNTNTADRCAAQSFAIAQQQTCPRHFTPPPENDPCVGRKDAKIADGVTRFSVEYYSAADNPATKINYPNPVTTTIDLAPAKSVAITLTSQSGTGNNTVSSTSQIRVTKKNGPNA